MDGLRRLGLAPADAPRLCDGRFRLRGGSGGEPAVGDWYGGEDAMIVGGESSAGAAVAPGQTKDQPRRVINRCV